MDKDQIIQKVLKQINEQVDMFSREGNSLYAEHRAAHAAQLSSLAQVYAVLNEQPVSFAK